MVLAESFRCVEQAPVLPYQQNLALMRNMRDRMVSINFFPKLCNRAAQWVVEILRPKSDKFVVFTFNKQQELLSPSG